MCLPPFSVVSIHATIRRVVLFVAITIALVAQAATGPYDEAADARNDLKAALAVAKESKVAVLVVFGANWCSDCRALDKAFKTGATAPLIEKFFAVVKVNVGRFDRNVELAETYGVPLKRGIPAIAVLNSDGGVTFATRAGELADAQQMGEKGIHDFFAKLAGGAK